MVEFVLIKKMNTNVESTCIKDGIKKFLHVMKKVGKKFSLGEAETELKLTAKCYVIGLSC